MPDLFSGKPWFRFHPPKEVPSGNRWRFQRAKAPQGPNFQGLPAALGCWMVLIPGRSICAKGLTGDPV